MIPTVPSTPCEPALSLVARRRALRRRSSAGGTMFVVAMTLAVLSAIGAWALQSAALEVRMAGYERQSTQTHYLAEYGVLAAMQDLGAGQLKAILKGPNTNSCVAVPCITAGTTFNCVPAISANPIPAIDTTCAKWLKSTDVSSAANYSSVGWTTTNPIDPSTVSSAAPGSLGATSMSGDFSVEVADVTSAPAAAGFSGNTPGLNFYWATITSYGQTNQSAATTGTNVLAPVASQGNETLRTRIRVGPG